MTANIIILNLGTLLWCRPWPAGGTFEQLLDRHSFWSGGKCMEGRGRERDANSRFKPWKKSKFPGLTSWPHHPSQWGIILSEWNGKCIGGRGREEDANSRLKSELKTIWHILVALHSGVACEERPCVRLFKARRESGLVTRNTASMFSKKGPFLYICPQ